MHSISQQEQQELLQLARQVIIQGIESGEAPKLHCEAYSDALRRPAATFVTLYLNGKLAGCIGQLTATRPLVLDVAENAYAAANNDHRFEKIKRSDLDSLKIEIALLSDLKLMNVHSEEQLKAQLVVNKDGLLIETLGHRATFLPKVWQALPDKSDFILHLKLKAGLPQDYWSDEIRCFRYTTESFSDV
ncbi:MAG: AmmeMemoRadiSam system protein A [Pseudomonadales bacterium]|nr:AmmeMemoRadiSam system protein A [Pseudomonadales bacterium]